MKKLNRNDCSTIFRARTRMLNVKNNYRNMHSNNICRKCLNTDETQEHVLEICPEIHTDTTTIVTKNKIFTDEPDELKEAAQKIRRALDLING